MLRIAADAIGAHGQCVRNAQAFVACLQLRQHRIAALIRGGFLQALTFNVKVEPRELIAIDNRRTVSIA